MLANYFSYLCLVIALPTLIADSLQAKCDLTLNAEAVSALKRASTAECKIQIENLACTIQNQATHEHESALNRTCVYANNNEHKRALYTRGCLTSVDFRAYITTESEVYAATRTSNETIFAAEFTQVKQLQSCIDVCLTQAHFKYAAFGGEDPSCVCVRYLKTGMKESLVFTIESLCKQSDESIYQIYHTGLIGKQKISNF
jgi:hypothetical protein